ncbi:hypothetical protein ACH4JZ_18430 [Streptomyces sp. NPDC017615]
MTAPLHLLLLTVAALALPSQLDQHDPWTAATLATLAVAHLIAAIKEPSK